MKYLTHMTTSHEDDKHELAMSLSGGGTRGLITYGLYWIIAEKIAGQIRPEQIVTWMTKTWAKWGDSCGIRPTYFRKHVENLTKAGLISLYCDDKVACVNMPNLLKYGDEYIKHILRKSGETPESIATKFRPPSFLLSVDTKSLKTGPVEIVDNSPTSDGATSPGGVLTAPPDDAPTLRRKGKLDHLDPPGQMTPQELIAAVKKNFGGEQ